MKPEVVFTKSAPKTGFSEGTESPIAQGVKCGGFLFVSGQGPLDPVTKTIVSEDIAGQTRVTLDNVRAVLEAGGTSIANVVRVGVYLRNMDDSRSSTACSRSTSRASSRPGRPSRPRRLARA